MLSSVRVAWILLNGGMRVLVQEAEERGDVDSDGEVPSDDKAAGYDDIDAQSIDSDEDDGDAEEAQEASDEEAPGSGDEQELSEREEGADEIDAELEDEAGSSDAELEFEVEDESEAGESSGGEEFCEEAEEERRERSKQACASGREAPSSKQESRKRKLEADPDSLQSLKRRLAKKGAKEDPAADAGGKAKLEQAADIQLAAAPQVITTAQLHAAAAHTYPVSHTCQWIGVLSEWGFSTAGVF